jgi:murein DD-endopeptidase MepM/ murein hydrolase activator NlpD
MNDHFQHDEPLADHLADTGKVIAVRPQGNRGTGIILLLGAMIFTIATVVILVLPPPGADTPVTPSPDIIGEVIALPTQALPTSVAEGDAQPTQAPIVAQPTLDPAQIPALLTQPPAQSIAAASGSAFQFVRDTYSPFTIIPDRPRTEVIDYEIQEGDTIFSIAERYGLKPETIAWSNDRSIIGGLRPGRIINIMPVDGAYWTVPSEQTIAQIATQFRVDPYAIIDSEFNDLFGATPETALPTGTRVVVPGGEAEVITWTARVETRDTSTSGAQNSSTSGSGQVNFEPGDPGSCGWVDNPGNPGTWVYPMNPGSYQWTRGYSSYHTGVDLSGTPGTPVMAANGGTVVFAGWNTYGYGNTVVLVHGPFMTLYAHMSAINVGCGQYVGAGQVVGAVGSTGNSSGPHLHFEIRYNNVTQDPTFTMPF